MQLPLPARSQGSQSAPLITGVQGPSPRLWTQSALGGAGNYLLSEPVMPLPERRKGKEGTERKSLPLSAGPAGPV